MKRYVSVSLLTCGLLWIAVSRSPHLVAQTLSPKLAWDAATSGVAGFAVTVDGARTDYHLLPLGSKGVCGCSIAVPFSGGRHVVTVSAYNAVGQATSAPLTVAPIAKPGGPYSAAVGSPLAVNGSASYHPAGTIVRWTWNWGDGTAATTAVAPTASHTYMTKGVYTITLVVQDNAGATASATTAVTVATSQPLPSADPVVIWTASVPAAGIHGNWARLADSSAAGGVALANADRGAAKVAPALANPVNYFDQTFTAAGSTRYHLWVRMRAQNDSLLNDSIHVQFSDAVGGGGSAMGIGTSASAEIVLQDGSSGASPHGWGWADNGWGAPGADIVFASTGVHTIRVQQREDGAIVDQIVLLPSATFGVVPPGPRRDDTTILQTSAGTVQAPVARTAVLWMADLPTANVHGSWFRTPAANAAGGFALVNPDAGKGKIAPALAAPANYFDATFTASAGVPYHVWVRVEAQGNSTLNDSIHMQFSDAVTATGAATMRIGTASSAEFVLQDGSGGASLLGWGWTDNGWSAPGPDIYFKTSGTHTLRVQQREDGVSIDQIVISGDVYRTIAPGARRNDATILLP